MNKIKQAGHWLKNVAPVVAPKNEMSPTEGGPPVYVARAVAARLIKWVGIAMVFAIAIYEVARMRPGA